LVFLIALIVLFVYWQRSLVNIGAAIRPIHPTPSEGAQCAVLTARIGQ